MTNKQLIGFYLQTLNAMKDTGESFGACRDKIKEYYNLTGKDAIALTTIHQVTLYHCNQVD